MGFDHGRRLNFVREPRQERSEATLARIVEAASRLFAERRSVDVPVREICELAGASKSSFYARFPSTQTLVRVVYDRFAARVLEVADVVDARWMQNEVAGRSLEAFVHEMIGGYARFFDDERGTLVAFRAAERSDPELVERRLALDSTILDRTIRAACHHFSELEHARVEAALRDGIGVIAAAARGTFDFADELSIASDLDRDHLVRQLSDLILQFLFRDPQVRTASEDRPPSAVAF